MLIQILEVLDLKLEELIIILQLQHILIILIITLKESEFNRYNL